MKSLVLAAVVATMGSAVSALTLTTGSVNYNNDDADLQPDYTLSIMDVMGGVQIDASASMGDILAFGFDADFNQTLTLGDFQFADSSVSATGLCVDGMGSNSLCNSFNGTERNAQGNETNPFDYVVQLNSTGSGSGGDPVDSFSLFLASDLTVEELGFGQVGFRVQSLGEDGGGSSKDLVTTEPSPMAPVPLPATGLLLLAGVGGLGLARRRRAAA